MIDHEQCVSCRWRGGAISQAGGIFCDLLGKTGISRVAAGSPVDDEGRCLWYKCDEGMTPYKQKQPEPPPKPPEPAAPAEKKKRGRRTPSGRYGVAMLDEDGDIVALFSGPITASELTGRHKQEIYDACNWRRLKERGRPYAGNVGRKGYTFRYVSDPDIADRLEDYHGPKDKRPQI